MKSTVSAQDFWCITLDKDNRECVWKHDDEQISHHLMVEQVIKIEELAECRVINKECR